MDYVETFKNLKTNNKFRRKSPHKAILLLSIIELYESCTLIENMIKYDDELLRVFHKMWNKVLPSESTFLPDAYLPFWFMQSEGFWHIVPIRGKEDILSLMRDSNTKPSESKLKDCVNYVELDEDLYFLMTLPSGRSSLKRALLETYSTLSTRVIDRMSASEDNFVDNSVLAFNKYENILNSNTSEVTCQQKNSDEEIEKRFFRLKEDIQYVLNINYYTFLKNHPIEREMFKEICPSVYELYDKMTLNPIRQGEIAPSLAFTYENFLADLKITLMSEDGSFELIDSINAAIASLREQESKVEIFQFEDEEDNTTIIEGVKQEEIVLPANLRPLTPALESRKGKAWSENEEELIVLYYNQGYSFEDIALAMGRTEVSIKTRLASLGIIEYSYEDDTVSEPIEQEPIDENKPIDFYVENSTVHCSIFNRLGKRVFTTNGKLKIFHGKAYRFNYKEGICFTVKEVKRNGEIWNKGSKKLVSYVGSDLFPLLDKHDFIDQIEDFVEGVSIDLNKMCVDGKWYNFDGDCIGVNTNAQNSIKDDANRETSATIQSDYIPKGKLKNINEVVTSSYDYLWLIAIIDFMGEKQHTSSLSYDELACMMIANAWEILADNPELKEKEQILTDCIEFLIEESKEYMDEELDWTSTKDTVFAAIKDYPMAGVFEDTVDEMIKDAPFNILKAWIKEEGKIDLIMYSIEFKNACLYAIHSRKVNPFIEVNPSWKCSLYLNHYELTEYFKAQYLNYIKNLINQ